MALLVMLQKSFVGIAFFGGAVKGRFYKSLPTNNRVGEIRRVPAKKKAELLIENF